jgi:hypothetical protein
MPRPPYSFRRTAPLLASASAARARLLARWDHFRGRLPRAPPGWQHALALALTAACFSAAVYKLRNG